MLAVLVVPGVLADASRTRPFALLPGAGQAVRDLNDSGWRVVAVLARAEPDPDGAGPAAQIEHRLREALGVWGARLDDTVLPQPLEPGMPREKAAAAELAARLRRYGATPADTVVVADSNLDLEAAAILGCRRVLVRTGRGAATQAAGVPATVLPLAVHADLAAAVRALRGSEP